MIILRGKTHKAKNLIKKWGNRWDIIHARDGQVLVQSQKDKSSMNKLSLADSARWVNLSDDSDFEVESRVN